MKRYITYIFIILLHTSCSDFLNINAPKNQLVSETVFVDESHANAAMIGLYISMNSSGNTSFRIPLLTGLYGDELKTYASNNLVVQHYQNALLPIDAYTNSFWSNMYNWIYQANAILEGCENSMSLDSNLKQQLMAEAYFIRAFCYFYLVNLYGDVPLLLTTNYEANAVAARHPSSEVYQQIQRDLEIALRDLNTGYVDGSGISIYAERLRPNQSAAQALLARVFLYGEQWALAENAANEVISKSNLYDTVSVKQVFLKNSKEAIWQLQKVFVNIQGTYEGQYFQITTRPVTSDLNSATISPSLLNSFESNDLRLLNWIGVTTDGPASSSITYHFSNKFKDRSTSNPTEYTTPLRLAEQYLIRAEARAQQDNITGALADLNIIRRRAGLSPLTSSSRITVLDAILNERRKEFFTEWGHRWLDLKRTEKVDAVMTVEVIAKGIPGTWSNYKQLWPIPERDIESNPNLAQHQNPGYN